MKLEQILYEPRQTLETKKEQVYRLSDLEQLSVVALYTAPIRIRDLPGSGAQLHIHGKDLNHIDYGKIKSYHGEILKELNGYETSMADLYAHLLGIKKLDKGKDYK